MQTEHFQLRTKKILIVRRGGDLKNLFRQKNRVLSHNERKNASSPPPKKKIIGLQENLMFCLLIFYTPSTPTTL